MGRPLEFLLAANASVRQGLSLRKGLVCGGQHLGLHKLHRDATTFHLAIAWLDAKHFRVARLALKSLA
jgi:hypothetical protein